MWLIDIGRCQAEVEIVYLHLARCYRYAADSLWKSVVGYELTIVEHRKDAIELLLAIFSSCAVGI